MKTRAQKEAMCQQLHEKFSKATVAIFTRYDGMTDEQLKKLRFELRSAGGEFRIVKNTVARRAAEGTALAVAAAAFEGPVALTLGYKDPILPAKVLKAFTTKNEKLRIRTGVVEGRACDPAQVMAIASLPSREVLLGQLVNRLNAPVARLAQVLQALPASLARAVSAVSTSRTSGGHTST
jgi:ribosomal protein L10